MFHAGQKPQTKRFVDSFILFCRPDPSPSNGTARSRPCSFGSLQGQHPQDPSAKVGSGDHKEDVPQTCADVAKGCECTKGTSVEISLAFGAANDLHLCVGEHVVAAALGFLTGSSCCVRFRYMSKAANTIRGHGMRVLGKTSLHVCRACT